MARYQETEVAVPIVIPAGSGAGIFFVFAGGVLLAVLTCIVVCCAYPSGPASPAGDVTPAATTSSCEPFCLPVATTVGGAR